MIAARMSSAGDGECKRSGGKGGGGDGKDQNDEGDTAPATEAKKGAGKTNDEPPPAQTSLAGISLPDAGKTDAQPSDKPEDVAGDVFDKSPEETARNVCAHCGAAGIEEAPLLRCAKCKTRLFCSKKCQRKDWVAGHRGTCTTPEQM
jgi:hypothetical protein